MLRYVDFSGSWIGEILARVRIIGFTRNCRMETPAVGFGIFNVIGMILTVGSPPATVLADGFIHVLQNLRTILNRFAASRTERKSVQAVSPVRLSRTPSSNGNHRTIFGSRSGGFSRRLRAFAARMLAIFLSTRCLRICLVKKAEGVCTLGYSTVRVQRDRPRRHCPKLSSQTACAERIVRVAAAGTVLR